MIALDVEALEPYFHIKWDEWIEATNVSEDAHGEPYWVNRKGEACYPHRDCDVLVRYDVENPGSDDEVRVVAELGEGWMLMDAVLLAVDDLASLTRELNNEDQQ